MTESEVVIIEESDTEDDEKIEVVKDNECREEIPNDDKNEYDSYIFRARTREDDPFGYMMKISVDLFEYKCIRWFTMFSFCMHFFTISFTVYYLITELDKLLIFKYNSFVVFEICSVFLCWYSFPYIAQMQKLRNSFEENALDPQLYPQQTKDFLQKYGTIIKILFATSITSFTLGTCLFLFSLEAVDDSIYHIHYLRKKCANPEWFFYFQIVHNVVTLFTVLLATAMMVCYVYYVLAIYLHSLTMRGYFEFSDIIETTEKENDEGEIQDENKAERDIKNEEQNEQDKDEEESMEEQEIGEDYLLKRPDNAQYQNEVNRRLKFCFKLYNHLQTLKYECKKAAFFSLIVLTVINAVFIFSITYQLFFVLSTEYYCSCILQLCMITITCISPPIQAQILTDESDLVNTTIWNAPWYQWNITNQKMVLFAMISSIKPHKLAAGNFIVIDYTMIIRMLRYIHTLVTLMTILRDKQIIRSP